MGPPSQQGKFRPKKPPKKKPAPAPAAAAVPDAAGSSSTTTAPTAVDFAPATAAGRASSASGGRHGGGGRGRGGRGSGRGGGRGGRGGRSRGPTGTTFFTASDKPSSAALKKKRNLDKSRRMDEGDEEIVDVLEVGVGSVKGKKKGAPIKKENLLDSMDRMDYNEDGYGGGGGGGGASDYIIDGAMYDSDSSKEEAKGKQRNDASSKRTQPLELPFPIANIPLGVGQSERPKSYEDDGSNENQKVASDTDAMDEKARVKSNDNIHAEESASPFVNVNQKQDLLWEQNNWFLVQLPTRLPPLKKQQTSSTNNNEDDEMNGTGDNNSKDAVMGGGDGNDAADQSSSNITTSIADVATPPIIENSFDNVLTRTAPGRIGKMKVYKSGKTVLVLDSQDGSKEVRLNVHEGLTCGFLQQAVAIDMENSKYISLGDVTKSVVISPNLD